MEVPSPQSLRKELLWLQQSLSVLGSPVVLSHNDLLCKNIIYNQKEGECKLKRCSLRHFCVTGVIFVLGSDAFRGFPQIESPAHLLLVFFGFFVAAKAELIKSD